jgi:diketogulonate reductase-like aldo/keto reductase
MTSAAEIIFGTGGLRSPEAFTEAWRAGYRVFDTAVYYANDAPLVAALDACGSAGEARLVHKVQPHRVSEQFERLIRPRLGGRPLDTLLLHHPALFVLSARPDALMKPWAELEKLVERGLVRRIGLSNAGPAFFEHLLAHATVKPAVSQIEAHPGCYDAALVGGWRERGIEVQAFSPLGSGRVPVLTMPEVQEAARRTGRSAAQVCLRWSIQKGMVPIARAARPEHMRDNREALAFSLDEAQVAAIDRVAETGRAWDDPIKRGCLAATITPDRIVVPNRPRFALRSALHYAAVATFLRRGRAR